jgi:hypothetical protein
MKSNNLYDSRDRLIENIFAESTEDAGSAGHITLASQGEAEDSKEGKR